MEVPVSRWLQDVAAAVFEEIDPKGPIEVALLMRRTGTILGAWTKAKAEVPREIVSVMAATMVGSIETMSEALGCPSPERAAVETERCRILVEKFEPHGILVLISTKGLSSVALQRVSRGMLDRLTMASKDAPKSRATLSTRI